jgi:putative ABC transport system permease protein
MRWFRYFGVAFESILAHKLRAALTMLGIVIGVAAVLTTLGIGRGASASITGEIAEQGTTLITISPGASSSGGVTGSSGSARTLTLGDAEALADGALHPDVAMVVAQYSGSAQLVAGSSNTREQVVGTTAGYAAILNLEVAQGRFLEAREVDEQQSVVVLGATIARTLFGRVDVVGDSVRIEGEPFLVVGVLAESGSGGFGSSDTQSFVPIGVAQSRLFSAPRYRGELTVTQILAQASAEDRVDPAQRQMEQTLRLRHGLRAGDDNDFNMTNQASLLDLINTVTSTLTLFLGSIGAISLLVGGIGIMNIMLVSVTERTKEIGLRRALGAHDSDLLLQFVIEALVLTVLGGLLGIALSYSIAVIVSNIPGFTFNLIIEADSLVMALGVSAASGLIFGLYPAFRAMQLDPIDALRYE